MATKKLILGIIILAIGVLVYWLVLPLFITTKVDEKLSELPNQAVGSVVMARGNFVDGAPGHYASGEVVLLKQADGSYAVRFEDDFKVTNGPDLFVYLGRDGKYDKVANLGQLKGSEGGQNYLVPAEIVVEDYNEVYVWCRAFSVEFGSAKLVQVPDLLDQ